MVTLVNGVPDTRLINGQSLSSDIILTPELIKSMATGLPTVSNEDWNTLVKPGCHAVANASGLNRPVVTGFVPAYYFGHLLVMSSGGVNSDLNTTQIYFQEGRGGLFYRNRWDGSWREWRYTPGSDSFHINYSVDLDTLTTSGQYNMYKGASSVIFTNAPSNFDFGTLQVIGRANYSQSFCTQILTWRSDGHQMIRTRNDGGMAWTPWKKIYSESQKPAPGDINALSISGGVLNGTLEFPSSVRVGQFRGPQNGNTPLNELYSSLSGAWSYVSNISGGTPNLFPVNNNANAVLTFNSHTGDFGHQIGLSSNGKLYHRYFKDTRWGAVYTEINKPTASDVGAAPGGFGLGESARNTTAQDERNAGFWRDVSIATAGITMPYDGSPSQAFVGVDMDSGKLKFGLRTGATSVPINWRYVSSEVLNSIVTIWNGTFSSGQTITLSKSILGRTIFFKPDTYGWSLGVIMPPADGKLFFNFGAHWYELLISDGGTTINMVSCASGSKAILSVGIAG